MTHEELQRGLDPPLPSSASSPSVDLIPEPSQQPTVEPCPPQQSVAHHHLGPDRNVAAHTF
jgi:hypothetical protein